MHRPVGRPLSAATRALRRREVGTSSWICADLRCERRSGRIRDRHRPEGGSMTGPPQGAQHLRYSSGAPTAPIALDDRFCPICGPSCRPAVPTVTLSPKASSTAGSAAQPSSSRPAPPPVAHRRGKLEEHLVDRRGRGCGGAGRRRHPRTGAVLQLAEEHDDHHHCLERTAHHHDQRTCDHHHGPATTTTAATVIVPNVYGQTAAAAQATLASVRLVGQTGPTTTCTGSEVAGTVYGRRPPQGERGAGSTVTLTACTARRRARPRVTIGRPSVEELPCASW